MFNYNQSAGVKLIIAGVFISNAISGMSSMRMSALARTLGRSQGLTSTGTLRLSTQNAQAMRLSSLSRAGFNQRLLQSTGSYNNDYNWKKNQQTNNQANQSRLGRLCGVFGFGAAYAAYQAEQNKVVYAQEKDIFYSQILNELQEIRDKKELTGWMPGRNDSFYSLEMLHRLLYESSKDEYKSMSNWVKSLAKTEFIKKHHPEFYHDVIISIFKAYAQATEAEHSILNEKIAHIFGGESEHEQNLTKNLVDALNILLEQTINLPAEHAILENISLMARLVNGQTILAEWQRLRPIASMVVRDPQLARPSNAPIFDRDRMVGDNGNLIEGYWALYGIPNCAVGRIEPSSKDFYDGKYPIVKANPEPMPRQEEFLERLKAIEQSAMQTAYGGVSPSRFEDIHVGNTEYSIVDQKTGKQVCWPQAFGPYYVRNFNVRPSEEFYNFVMNYEVPAQERASSRVME